ncbi:thymidylate synthase [Sulfitobacter sp. TSTF-M16]|uniref:Thymidylate synthase n=2 Tax=Sulfitobacter aestuariivivens TaxID=2766981 RepID=A0A927D4M2_9RHOB|nr:thymidylate synthase [Sulfitobacter aestuariivivens]MBD3662746.1 thymidylate synthase [Sulfitobacter aestuariivivens]
MLGLGLVACGGGDAPFGQAPGDETDTAGIPEELASDLESFTYNPDNQTLTIRGINLEDGRFEDVYRRRPALDRGDYEAYTAQDGSLDRHSTAYVRDIRGTRAAIAVTGGQFTYIFAGGSYANQSYTAPVLPGSQIEGGLVSYAGNYIGMLNVEGSGEDLIPVTPGTPEGIRPTQAAEITGTILVNASFSDGTVNGTITDRVIVDIPSIDVADLDLAPTGIEADGTFFGQATVGNQVRGEYGGIFGGPDATEIAGVVHAQEHIATLQNEEEYGLFVLAQCGTEGADPLCNQPVP